MVEVEEAMVSVRGRANDRCELCFLTHISSVLAYLSVKRSTILDAIRISDGRIVTIKKVYKRFTPWEEGTIRRFSEEPLASDIHNHAIPLYESIHPSWDDDIVLLVMPTLMRIHKHRFATVGEAVECFRQLFEVRFGTTLPWA